MATYPDQQMPMGPGGMGSPFGTPPIIRGLTQLSPERMQAVEQGQGQGPPMEPEAESAEQLPRLVAAQFSLLQQASELGPDAFELLSTMAMTAIKQFKKQLTPMGMNPVASPPMYGGSPPMQAAPQAPQRIAPQQRTTASSIQPPGTNRPARGSGAVRLLASMYDLDENDAKLAMRDARPKERRN